METNFQLIKRFIYDTKHELHRLQLGIYQARVCAIFILLYIIVILTFLYIYYLIELKIK